MPLWRIDLLTDGRVATLHHDTVAQLLKPLGSMSVKRLTDVQFVEGDQCWHIYPVYNACVPIKVCKSFVSRANAIAHEIQTFTQMADSYGELL